MRATVDVSADATIWNETERKMSIEGTEPKTPVANQPSSPYGGGPSTGLQFPPYYKPTPSVRSRNVYFPYSETVGKEKMRVSFIGSCPIPQRRDQAGTCIMVELVTATASSSTSAAAASKHHRNGHPDTGN